MGDAALAARDSKAMKSEAVVAAVDNFDLSGLSEAASRIEHANSWNDVDQQIDESGDEDEEYKHIVHDDDKLEESAYTAGSPTDDPELLEQFDTLMHPHLKCMLMQVEGVFKKHVSFSFVSRVPEAPFLLLEWALLTAWLSHPLIENQ